MENLALFAVREAKLRGGGIPTPVKSRVVIGKG